MGAGRVAADIFDPLDIFHSGYKKQKQAADKAAAQQKLLAAKGIETVETEQARTMAAEEARGEVMGLFGAPGTFGQTPGTETAGAPSGSIYDTTSDRTKTSSTAMGLMKGVAPLVAPSKDAEGNVIPMEERKDHLFGPREGILDPKAYAGKVSESTMFQIRSQLTSEAQQMINQEGPAWEMLSQSTLGPIVEGAAMMQREQLRDIRNRMAKGGTARRTAFADYQKIASRERSNRMRVHETWQANLALHQYARANAAAVEAGNFNFIDNLPQLRQAYGESMKGLAGLMTAYALPAASEMAGKAYGMEASVQRPKVVQKLIMGVVSAAAGYYTGGAAKGLMSSATTAGPGAGQLNESSSQSATAMGQAQGLGTNF